MLNEMNNIIQNKKGYKVYKKLWLFYLFFLIYFIIPLPADAYTKDFNNNDISDMTIFCGSCSWSATTPNESRLNFVSGSTASISTPMIYDTITHFKFDFDHKYSAANSFWFNFDNASTRGFQYNLGTNTLSGTGFTYSATGFLLYQNYTVDSTITNNNIRIKILYADNGTVASHITGNDQTVSYTNIITDRIMIKATGINTYFWIDNILAERQTLTESTFLKFNQTTYNLTQPIGVNYVITNGDTSNYIYRLSLYDSSGLRVSALQLNVGGGTGYNTFSGTWIPTLFNNSQPNYYIAYITKQEMAGTNINFFINYTQFVPYGINFNTTTGNLSLNKQSLNRTETLLINYSISSNGRLLIRDSSNNYWYYNITSGNNQSFPLYIASDDNLGNWLIKLQYNDNVIWTTLNYSYFTVNSLLPSIKFQSNNYYIGDDIGIISYGGNYILLTNSQNIILANYTIIPNKFNSNIYSIPDNAITGIWSATLFTNNQITITTYTNINSLNTGITPTPTITPYNPSNTPTSLLEIGNNISEIFVGRMVDENGVVTDVKIKETGNKMFGFLLMIVIIILLSGTYYALKGKKR